MARFAPHAMPIQKIGSRHVSSCVVQISTLWGLIRGAAAISVGSMRGAKTFSVAGDRLELFREDGGIAVTFAKGAAPTG